MDVAKAAGVSMSTASKALNDRVDVSTGTRDRVQSVASELGYIPNALARALSGGPTSTVGVITSDLEGRFALPILMGVEDALGTDRVLTFLCDARGDEMREERLLRALLDRRVDGIIMVGRQTDPRPSLGQELPVPVVYAYSESDDERDYSVTVDNHRVGCIAAEHLLSLGRTRIAHISGEPGHGAAKLRLDGLRDTIVAAGHELAGQPLFGEWSEGWGRAATAALLDSGVEFDAIFGASDQLARGAIDTLRERGMDVPRDVAVLGVDNWAVLAENARTPLTTVDLRLQRLGRVAAARLLSARSGKKVTGVELLDSTLVIRNSTLNRM